MKNTTHWLRWHVRADRTVLLWLYRSLIRSKLDYGCIVYGSTRQSYIKQLDSIHHQGPRIAPGAFRTSPAQSLYVEAHEPSLCFRRLKRSLYYVTNSKSHRITLYTAVFSKHKTQSFSRHLLQKILPLGLRILPQLKKSGINLDLIDDVFVPSTAPWTLPPVRLDLATFEKRYNWSSTIQKVVLDTCFWLPWLWKCFYRWPKIW